MDEILKLPKDEGIFELIVRHPKENERKVWEEAELNVEVALVGDNWKIAGSSRTADGFGHPEMQLT
ncbi:MAG: hypothetical protein KIS76_06845 [Pyrinomonadaceae bacterium]|nr:hypothetical protein [Pyrinomonadaceae bacterium]